MNNLLFWKYADILNEVKKYEANGYIGKVVSNEFKKNLTKVFFFTCLVGYEENIESDLSRLADSQDKLCSILSNPESIGDREVASQLRSELIDILEASSAEYRLTLNGEIDRLVDRLSRIEDV